MSQLNQKPKKNPAREAEKKRKISFSDIEDNNGLVLQGQRIPQELLLTILDYVDCQSLIECKRVCKLWFLLIRTFVLERRIKRILSRPPVDEQALWRVFHAIWNYEYKIPFGKNFIKHGNACRVIETDEAITTDSRDYGEEYYEDCRYRRYDTFDDTHWKKQDVYLNKRFPQYILDNIKPTVIKIWDGYRSEKDRFGKYECKIEIIQSKERLDGGNVVYEDVILDSHSFSKTIHNKNELGKWLQFYYQFISFEKGIYKVSFYHEGKNNVQMAGTTVLLEFPCKRKMKKYVL